MQKNRPVITEAKLRRIIRDELARQYLVQEGILDVISKPFKKLGDKAKATVAKKADELLAKAKEAMGKMKSMDEMKKFLKDFSEQENGMSMDQLVSSVPSLDKIKAESEKLKDVDVTNLMKKPAVKEGMSFYDLRMSLILIEEKYSQKIEGQERLNESVVGTVAGLWWLGTKTVVGFLGLISFLLSSTSKVAKFLGFDKVAEWLEHADEFVEHVEESFLSKMAFPAPAQYAAYRAFHGLKAGVAKSKDKEGPGKALDYKQFMSEEGKEERDAAIKALKSAVIFILVFEALTHIIKSAGHFLHAISESADQALEASKHVAKGVEHAGIEGTQLARAAKAAAAAGEEMAAVSGIVGAERS